MDLYSLRDKSVTLIGYGLSNRALLKFLTKNGIFPSVRCPKAVELPSGIRGIFGDGYLNVSEEICFRSPAVHPDKIAGNAKIYTDCDLFLNMTRAHKIGVTGSDGKTTTTTLIYEIFKADKKRAHLCGNVGVALGDVFDNISDGDFVACELSSFQLHQAEIELDTAVITHISENHLDYHTDMNDYVSAKKNILKHTPHAVVNYDMQRAYEFFAKNTTYFSSSDLSLQAKNHTLGTRAHYVYIKDGFVYYDSECLFPLEIIRLKGVHNVYNVLAAVGATYKICSLNAIISAVSSFSGVPHRNEEIYSLGGVKFIKSSADTSPARTVTTLENYKNERVVSIMGGSEKGLDYSPLKEVAKNLTAVILLGANREKISKEISAFTKVIAVNDINEATKTAYELARPSGYVILTPASASFDMYIDYKDRAEKFKQAALRLNFTD